MRDHAFPCFYKEDVLNVVDNLKVMDRELFPNSSQDVRTTPPQYVAHEVGPSTNHSAPPPYHLEQPRLPVGGKVPKDPFMTVPQLKVHLELLGALRKLWDRVADLEANHARNKLPSLAQELGSQERWTWFLELALER